MLLLRNKVHQ